MSSSHSQDQRPSDAYRRSSTSSLLQPCLSARPTSSLRNTSCDDETNLHRKISSSAIPRLDKSVDASGSDVKLTIDHLQEASSGTIKHQIENSQGSDQNEPEQRPPFAPFFTLINSGETTAHPRQVHYLFSDDDTSDTLIPAILQSLFGENHSHASLNRSTGLGDWNSEQALATGEKSSRKNPVTKFRQDTSARKKKDETDSKIEFSEPEERVIIVDLNSAGNCVTGVSSLSSKWQVLNAQIEDLPIWNGANDSQTHETNDLVGNVMLKIDGVAHTDLDTYPFTLEPFASLGIGVDLPKEEGNILDTKIDPEEEEMWSLLESFNQKMSIHRRIMGTRPRLDPQDTVTEESVIERRVSVDG
ncbi:putative anaphase promoting complex subunit protein [Golovinomyces cichoracearum]|uniref:Putative anaphase promoting complex subunit protein n=1 Tax=Golovinomyces cichoracearum TaxID=62708 RepID=A0A420IMP8_9PEZI|nr:putative anaphase promoting complex subunit protein [Golovinomyces cichoracearum]